MEKKTLFCPECGRRLIDSNETTISELRSKKKIPVGWNADYFQKCWKCGEEIGIKKVS